jgi:hypothetical protein
MANPMLCKNTSPVSELRISSHFFIWAYKVTTYCGGGEKCGISNAYRKISLVRDIDIVLTLENSRWKSFSQYMIISREFSRIFWI